MVEELTAAQPGREPLPAYGVVYASVLADDCSVKFEKNARKAPFYVYDRLPVDAGAWETLTPDSGGHIFAPKGPESHPRESADVGAQHMLPRPV